MGVRSLQSFMRKNVPNGCRKIYIEREICNHRSIQDQSETVIVIDLLSLVFSMRRLDLKALLCGGRFSYVCSVMDQFFSELRKLGATLEFFCDGPSSDEKFRFWTQKQENRHSKIVDIINHVDQKYSIGEIMDRCEDGIWSLVRYPLKHIAAKHGKITSSLKKPCSQELVNYANKVNALAVITCNSNYLIFEGAWKYWCSYDIDFVRLTTTEYERQILVTYLNLDQAQMPLFATLCGNDFILPEEVASFHSRIGRPCERLKNIANFIRNQSWRKAFNEKQLLNLMIHVFEETTIDEDLLSRFRKSLDFYDSNFIAPTASVAYGEKYSAYFQKPIHVVNLFVDGVIENRLPMQLSELLIPLLIRQAGIILCQRRTDFLTIVTFTMYLEPLPQNIPIEFPDDVDPPPIEHLLSKEPETLATLKETKKKLLCWISSDSLDYRRLQSVPEILQTTVVSLYYLVEKQVLKLFEADLLLLIAYDVAFKTYNFEEVQYPYKLDSRAFRIAFLVPKIYAEFANIIERIGMDGEIYTDYPLFDGPLFHNRYAEWSRGYGSLEHIEKWRIYDRLECLQ